MLDLCPCGSGKLYVGCCGRLHSGVAAGSAEDLMRSRYSAFVRNDTGYLLRSWAPETRPRTIDHDPAQIWTGLTIEDHETTGPDTATVRFVAHWRRGTVQGQLSETSRFRRDGDGWVYVDGVID